MIRGAYPGDRVRVLSALGKGLARTEGKFISDGCVWDLSKGNEGTVISVRRLPSFVFVRVRPDPPGEGIHTFGPRDLERAP